MLIESHDVTGTTNNKRAKMEQSLFIKNLTALARLKKTIKIDILT